MTELKEGLVGKASETVLYTNVAAKLGSGSLNVYATPAMIALMEKAACAAVADAMEEGNGTVGTHMNVSHDAATLPGRVVTATATLTKVEGRALTFAVEAECEGKTIGKGEHHRFVINNEKFLSKLK